jgi:adenylate cyclase
MKGLGRFKISSNRNLRTLLLLLVATFATALGIVAYGTHLLRSLDLSTVNTRFSIRGKEKPPKNIVIVKIDDKTFQDLNQQFPFPRKTEAQLIDRIGAAHPAVIAFDVQFSESSNLGQNDDIALLTSINNFACRWSPPSACANNKLPPVRSVFSFTETNANGDVRFLGSGVQIQGLGTLRGKKLLENIGALPGNGLFPFDPGGNIRRMSYSIGKLPTLGVVTAGVAKDRPITRSQFGGGSQWIDFVGPAGSYPSVSFSDAALGRVPASFFRGKIVIVGATAPSLQDIHPTSTDSQMPGPEIQANAINTVLRGFPLSSVPGWVNIVLIVLLGVAVPLAGLRLGAVTSVALAGAIGVLFAVAVQLAFNSGAIVSFVYPLGALILAAIGSLAVHLITEAFERIRTRDLFSRFVPENVVDEVLASSDGLRLGGVQRSGTVMFTDLRGFTSFAEKLTPSQVIDVLNHYLSEMSDAILNHGGTLVAYMGDGIFAVFGAPLEMPDHADRALATAREMLEVRLQRFNQWIRDQGLGDGFRMGIGLNSGNVMSGHVGSERRVEYAAVGDTTNTASRLESMTKGTPHQLFLSESTREALTQPPEDLVYVDEVAIRGRVERLKLWSVKEHEPAEADAPAGGEVPAQV